ncbi:bifunctional metallophosphatase/5'-nucleotidase [Companilactobacillus mishanensis]|uniref:bifunctional metallophosphatase/5'-nucleotidase n=1 Tax=Companilactobacillus mishanensis TaxID=2486008 RepID=UPI0012971836|nr:bifunctional UDP-sugar hydrolase/5'-nucleotidase [Companilactobacillus mishanensis]MQS89281.1 bifunctional metallophosphatase/5'-nucleotidase [Companilactobacillus mishanensis]
MENIKIIHTNDLHSHFENFPKIERFIKQERQSSEHGEFFLFDIGDAMDRAHPLSEATDGRANIDWMNLQHYDGATIGNNEGLGNDYQHLSHLYDDANFSVILGNLYDKKTEEIANFAQQYKTITTKAGTKIGVIGFTAPYILTYPLLGWDIRLMQDEMPKVLTKLRDENCDVVVLLSHLGVSMDRMIANKYPEIDVIIGSHTHHLFKNGEMDNGVLLAAAGKYGQHIGTIELHLDKNKVISKKAFTTETASLPSEASDDDWIQKKYDQGEQILDQKKIAKLPYTMTKDINGEHPVIEEGLNAIQKFTDADAGVLSSGLFLTDLKEGIVTAKDLHNMLPHAIHVMKTTMTGNNVWRMVMEMEKNRPFLRRHLQKGMGFRGKIFGELVYRGITIDKKRNVYINGHELEMNKEYKLALLDHYMFVPFFPTIEIVGENEIMYPDFLRNVFADYLREKYPI